MVRKSPPPGGTHVERAGRAKGPSTQASGREVDHLTPDEMLDWLRREVIAVNKEAQLRVDDATKFVTEYARGSMSADEANDRFLRYGSRWGDALEGIHKVEGRTDQDILAEMDRARLDRISGRSGKTPGR